MFGGGKIDLRDGRIRGTDNLDDDDDDDDDDNSQPASVARTRRRRIVKGPYL